LSPGSTGFNPGLEFKLPAPTAPRCFSSLGDQQKGQILSLGPGCDHKAVIEHELLHALGFYHEQSRTDRDDYVDIWLDQVTPGTSGELTQHAATFDLS